MFRHQLDAVVAALPPEVAQTAQARGRGRDLWATARDLLAELAVAWDAGAAQLGTTRNPVHADEQVP